MSAHASSTLRSPEITAFARLMRAHSLLRRRLESLVLQPRGLTQNDFDTLLHLRDAEEGRLRRIDLAGLLMLSPSGVTRLLEGLEGSGLIANVQCESDARVTWATLTPAGEELLLELRDSHTEVLRDLFGVGLAEDEVEQLAELLGRLPGVGDGSCATDGGV